MLKHVILGVLALQGVTAHADPIDCAGSHPQSCEIGSDERVMAYLRLPLGAGDRGLNYGVEWRRGIGNTGADDLSFALDFGAQGARFATGPESQRRTVLQLAAAEDRAGTEKQDGLTTEQVILVGVVVAAGVGLLVAGREAVDDCEDAGGTYLQFSGCYVVPDYAEQEG